MRSIDWVLIRSDRIRWYSMIADDRCELIRSDCIISDWTRYHTIFNRSQPQSISVEPSATYSTSVNSDRVGIFINDYELHIPTNSLLIDTLASFNGLLFNNY